MRSNFTSSPFLLTAKKVRSSRPFLTANIFTPTSLVHSRGLPSWGIYPTRYSPSVRAKKMDFFFHQNSRRKMWFHHRVGGTLGSPLTKVPRIFLASYTFHAICVVLLIY